MVTALRRLLCVTPSVMCRESVSGGCCFIRTEQLLKHFYGFVIYLPKQSQVSHTIFFFFNEVLFIFHSHFLDGLRHMKVKKLLPEVSRASKAKLF